MFIYLTLPNIRKTALKDPDEMLTKTMGFSVEFNCNAMVGELNWKIHFDFSCFVVTLCLSGINRYKISLNGGAWLMIYAFWYLSHLFGDNYQGL